MSGKHAILGPSSASKWLVCTPSARLELTMPDQEGEAAKEGTLAHSLGELIIAQRSNSITNKEFRKQLAILESNKLYNKAMYEYADGYAIYVLEHLSAAKVVTPDAKLFTEQQLNLSAHIPEGFGTGDAGIIADHCIDLFDLKYGKGVRVEAEDNSQLKIYALGWLAEFDYLYDIHTIRMHIYQPRMNNIAVFEMDYVHLMLWADNVLQPKAKLAFAGEGEFVAGKHCQFCRAKAVCKANAEYQVQIACSDFDEFAGVTDETLALLTKNVVLMTDEEIVTVIARADSFANWLISVKEHALVQAKAGKKWPGYKLVSGKSFRKFTDPVAIQKIVIKEGFDRTKLFKEQEMIGITEMEKLIGKKLFDEKIAQYTVKAAGAPTLVVASDPRAEVKSTADDFSELPDDDLG